MIRRLAFVPVAMFLAVAFVAGASDVTYILKSGERQSGSLIYRHDDKLGLSMNGSERQFSFDDVAVISFVGGALPTRAEVDQLPAGENLMEHDRHTLVLKNGQAIRGKFYDFADDRVVIDVRNSSGSIDRKSYGLNEVARLYLSAPSSRNLFAGLPAAPAPANPSTVGGQGASVVRVEGARMFTDTRIDVSRGQQITFTTTGQARVNNDISVGPAGDKGLGTRRSLPVMNAGIGALVGRIGTGGKPFEIGASTSPIAMPAAGRLWLGINDDDFKDNGGGYDVAVTK